MLKHFFFTFFIVSFMHNFLMGEGVKDTIRISEVEVTATLFTGKLSRIPASVNVVSQSSIEGYGDLQLSSQLNSIPGVYMQSGTYNTNRLVIRGIGSRTPYSSNRIRAYLNDIPLTDGNGVTSIEDIDPERISRMEIIKGPSSALYGAGMGGTLKLSTGDVSSLAKVTYQGASFNSSRLNVLSGLALGKAKLSASYHDTHTDGYRQNNQYSKQSALITAGSNFESTSLELTLMVLNDYAQIPSSLDFETFSNTPEKAASNWLAVEGYEEKQKWLAGLTVDQSIGSNFSNRSTLFGGGSKAFERRPFNDLDDDNSRFGLRNQLRYHRHNLALVLGTELFTEQYKWRTHRVENNQEQTVNDIDERRNYFNLSLLMNYTLSDRLLLSAGANINRINYAYQGEGQEGTYAYPFLLSPRLGINYEVAKMLHLYASAGHGFSAPSLEETLLPDGEKNPELKPEQGWMYDAGIRFSSRRLYFDLGAYHIVLSDLLLTKRISEEQFTGINAGRSHHSGIEFQSEYRLLDREAFPGSLKLNGSLTLGRYRFVDFVDDGNDYAGNVLPGIPSVMVYAGMVWEPLASLKANVHYRYTGSQWLNDGNTAQADAWQLVEAKVTYDFLHLKRAKIALFAGVNNLFNVNYASMVLVNAPSFGGSEPRYFYPGQPRNVFMGLTVSL